MKALIISADNFEDTELLVPYYRLKEEGIQVDIASIRKGKIKGKHGYEVDVDKTLKEIPMIMISSFSPVEKHLKLSGKKKQHSRS